MKALGPHLEVVVDLSVDTTKPFWKMQHKSGNKYLRVFPVLYTIEYTVFLQDVVYSQKV
jgi:hypothetical protein